MKTKINSHRHSAIVYIAGLIIAILSVSTTYAGPGKRNPYERNHSSYHTEYKDHSDYRHDNDGWRENRNYNRRVTSPYRRAYSRRSNYLPIYDRGHRYLYRNGFFYVKDCDRIININTPFGLWMHDLPTRYFSVDYVAGRKIFIADGLFYMRDGVGFRLIRSPYRRRGYGGSCR